MFASILHKEIKILAHRHQKMFYIRITRNSLERYILTNKTLLWKCGNMLTNHNILSIKSEG